ncbi:WD40/YVTN/BNR-like repeat-containing protein [Salinisphaera aquimarina]|uniref:WD40/YVTN/BNR-like repeat-containing protein n=1 Tax=Salinisphaera aquimarina TaxID=2094031 RepID=A0ABV7EMT1_9GAMM
MLPVWIRPWLLGAVLCYAIFGVYWYLMAGYTHGWQEGKTLTLDTALAEPMDWDSLEATAAGADALLAVKSRGRDTEAEACAADGPCRERCHAEGQVATGPDQPVLNCLATTPKTDKNDTQQRVDRLIRQSHPLGLAYLLRSDGQQVAMVARLQGEIQAMRCGAEGRCYLLAELPDVADKTVFVSDDFGHHWRLAAQHALEKAYVPTIVGIDGERVWVDGYKRLYLSADGGRHWRVLVDDERLMAYRPGLLSESLYDDTNSDFFDWFMDDTGSLYAVAGGRYQRAPNAVMYQVDAASGDIVSAEKYDGAFTDIENGPDGQLFGIYRSNLPERYTLYRMRAGALQPVRASGSEPMRSLVANSHWLLLDIGRNDGEHRSLSRDGGQHWRPMNDIRIHDRMLFDPSGAGILHFGYTDRSDYYPYYWIRP